MSEKKWTEMESELARQFLVKAAAHCPSTVQAAQGDRELLAANCRLTMEAICDALEILTGNRGNFEAVSKQYRVRE